MDYLELARQALAAQQAQESVPPEPESCEKSERSERRSIGETDPGVERAGVDPLFRTDLRNKCEISPEQDALAALDDAEVCWRVAAFRSQIPARGPIGFLCARPPRGASHDTPGLCGSCGAPKESTQRFCCRACSQAKQIAIHEAREGVQPGLGP
jgi:hypothetical protein